MVSYGKEKKNIFLSLISLPFMVTFVSKENIFVDMVRNEISHQFPHDLSSHLFPKEYIFNQYGLIW